MTRLVSWLVGVAVVVAVLIVPAPPAYACSPIPTFVVTADHLAGGDYNDPAGQLTADYREWAGDDGASIEILGVYVYETIAAVDADGDYSSGSVSVPVEMWGQWPSTTDPRTIVPEDQSGEPESSCGWGASGRPLGDRSYSVVATSSAEGAVEIRIDDEGQTVLNATFGRPEIADRDLDIEDELIAQIQQPNGSAAPILVGVGVVAIAAAAAVMYRFRRTPDIDPASFN